jgi:ABC-type sugar transport system substrate-binding protein
VIQRSVVKVVMAMDTDPDTLEWIQKGVIAATISQKPYSMALVGLPFERQSRSFRHLFQIRF